MNADTIFALSSGAGRAAVAVIRISGRQTRFGLETLAGPLPVPRRAVLRTIASDGVALDKALVLWFPGPASFTGEDMAEIHCHGGRAVVASVVRALAGLGLRGAEPGEFTRRALSNGRLTLPEVEGLADLLAAETAAQHRQALAQADGILTRATDQWRASLIAIMALIEAHLDFADEGDVAEHGALERLSDDIGAVLGALRAAITSGTTGARIRDGLTVVLAGPVNAGKSSLANALAGRDVAIVTDVPGTTRDVIEVDLDLAGVRVTLVDTAGLRDTSDPVEAEGIRRARARAGKADLVLRLAPAGMAVAEPSSPTSWNVVTKLDSDPVWSVPAGSYGISVVTGSGLDELISALAAWACEQAGGEPAVVTRERHLACMRDSIAHLERAAAGVSLERLELTAEDVRLAVRSLDQLVGRVDVEQVLDAVFSGFCIGK